MATYLMIADSGLADDEENRFLLGVKCPLCGESTIIVMRRDKYVRWNNDKELIQNVWPDLTAAQREIMITGLHDTCFQEVAGLAE